MTFLSAMAAGLAVWWGTNLERYVGSSALSCGLFSCAALQIVRERPRSALAGVALAGLGLLFARIGLEFAGAWPAAWSALPADVSPESVAHMAGALVGTVPGSILATPDPSALQPGRRGRLKNRAWHRITGRA